MKNALTVDLEDYFHVSAYAGLVRQQDWDTYPSRVAENTTGFWTYFRESLPATFFVLGWSPRKSPKWWQGSRRRA